MCYPAIHSLVLAPHFPPHLIKDVDRSDGTILHIDNFGNVKFVGEIDAQNGDRFTLSIGSNKYHAIYWERMMERNDGELIIYPGSSFRLPEIGIVRGNAAKELHISWTDKITFTKHTSKF